MGYDISEKYLLILINRNANKESAFLAKNWYTISSNIWIKRLNQLSFTSLIDRIGKPSQNFDILK